MKTKLFCNQAALIIVLLSVFWTTAIRAQDKLDSLIPSSAMAAIFIKPQDALQQPGMDLVPREVITAFGKSELGFDPCKITEIMLLLDTPSGAINGSNDMPEFAAVVRFGESQKLPEDLVKKMGLRPGERNDGNAIYRGTSSEGEALYQHDDRTFIFGFESFINKMLSAKGANSSLLKLLSERQPGGHFDLIVAVEPIRGIIKTQLPPDNQLPPPFRDFLEIPDLIDSIAVTHSMARDGGTVVQVNAIDEDGAKKIKQLVKRGIAMGQQFFLASMMENIQELTPEIQDAVAAYVNRVGKLVNDQFDPKLAGNQLMMDFSSGESAQYANMATIGVLTGMLLPAVQQVREAARRTSAANNLRQLSLAALNYESAYTNFPAQGSYTKDGQPLLSWRVHILPFLDQDALYRQFKLDEPWDSPHNIKLLDNMPPVYRSPNSGLTRRATLLGVCGKGTMFNGPIVRDLGKITDGASNTIYFVEVNDAAAIEWTRPGDYELDETDPTWGVVGVRPGGFNAAFVDGSVQFIDHEVDDNVIRNMMLISDGNPIHNR